MFEALAAGPLAADRLAERLGLSPRGTRALLGALEELALVRREPAESAGATVFRLTGHGRAHWVDRDAPDFEADAASLWLEHIRRWAAELPEAVRRGEAPAKAGEAGREPGDEEASLARFMAAMANKDPALVERVADLCVARLEEGMRRTGGREVRALDLGGGPGTFARALAARGLRVVLADRPEVVAYVGERYDLLSIPELELWGGDFLEDLPDGEFDLVLLANITHILDAEANVRLLRRLAERIPAGGVLAILDFVRGLSPFAALFAITMLLQTERGGTYGREEYEGWLAEAGFEASRAVRLDADRHLITALRAGSPRGAS